MSKQTNKRTKTMEGVFFRVVFAILVSIIITRGYMWGLNWLGEETGLWEVQPIDFQRNLVMGILLFYMIEIKSFILWLWR